MLIIASTGRKQLLRLRGWAFLRNRRISRGSSIRYRVHCLYRDIYCRRHHLLQIQDRPVAYRSGAWVFRCFQQ